MPSTAKNRLLAIALLLAVAAMSTSPLGQTEQRREGRVRKAGNWAVGQYIVVLQDNVDALDVLREAELNHRGHRKHVYGQAVNGFTIRLASSAAEQLAQDPRVKYVQQDGFVHLAQVAASWGLDRIDQRFTPLDTFYNSDALGTGVIVHVLDTGVLASHQDFGGRASVAADYVDDDYNESTPVANDDGAPGQPDGVDCHGHGTHVAATIGGTSFGVAKGVTLRAHRVVNCSGYGLESDVIAAVDTITGTAERPAVVNMSLGGGSSDALDDAIRHSIQAGVVYVVAAGNQDQPAINYSPARVQEAITVGATTSTDARASFSNYGPSVDIFAPGAAITSAWITSDSSTAVLNGTSMATPHVSGLAALLLERDPTLTPAAVQQAIVAAATPNVLTDVKAGSPNLLLHADLDHPSAPQVALLTPVPGQQALSNRPLTIAWDASDREGLQAIDAVLSTNSGLTFQAIPECADLPPAATECQWQSAGPITSTARIRVIARDITGDEAFGQSTADFAIVTKPDLIVSALGNPPALLLPGASFSVSDTVSNVGNSGAGSSTLRYYLSLDHTKSSGDTQLSARTIAPLAAETPSSGTVLNTVPTSLATGVYWLLACADSTAVVSEADEANNCAAAATTLRVELPDLVQTGLIGAPGAIAPGVAFPVTVTVQNQGMAAAGASTTRFYLSVDLVKNTGDVLLSGTRSVSALTAESPPMTATVSVTVPASALLGEYYLLACADDLAKVRESNELNNCVASTAVSLDRPDLLVTAIANPPAAILPGGKFTVSTTVVNQGEPKTPVTTLRFYLSLDGVKGAGDIRLTATRSIAALDRGVSSTGNTTLTVPTTIATGTYQLLACADDTLVVAELDENNCRVAATALLVARPDLIVTSVTNPPAAVAPGGSFAITDRVQNSALVTAASSYTRYYLSVDALKDTGDVLLTGARSVPTLTTGAASSASKTVVVPAATPLGTYRLLACADDTFKVLESDEANNCREAATPVIVQ